MEIKWHAETRKVRDLVKWVKNPRKLLDKGLKDLRNSIDRFGVAEPIVIQPDGSLIGGGAWQGFRVI